jgi:DNA-directed RNA polymerase specialized sigma24 family protein
VLSNDVPREQVPLRITTSFEEFVTDIEPRLRGALVALYGTEDGRDATAEALAYAWEHWQRLMIIEHPAGYLFRVAQSRSRRRRQPVLFSAPEIVDHAFEPKLPAAVAALPEQQCVAVLLVHGLGYSVADVAELLSIKPTTVRNHLDRGLRRLRHSLGADHDAK